MENFDLAKKQAVYFLAKKSYFWSRLEDKLVKKGFSKESLKPVKQFLIEKAYINDEALAERELLKGHGPRFIACKYRIDHKISPEKERECLALFLKKKKYQCGKRAFQDLLRRGFSQEIIFKTIHVLESGEME